VSSSPWSSRWSLRARGVVADKPLSSKLSLTKTWRKTFWSTAQHVGSRSLTPGGARNRQPQLRPVVGIVGVSVAEVDARTPVSQASSKWPSSERPSPWRPVEDSPGLRVCKPQDSAGGRVDVLENDLLEEVGSRRRSRPCQKRRQAVMRKRTLFLRWTSPWSGLSRWPGLAAAGVAETSTLRVRVRVAVVNQVVDGIR
jgi:hypothetical protein